MPEQESTTVQRSDGVVSFRDLTPEDWTKMRATLSEAEAYLGKRLPASARDVQNFYEAVLAASPDHDEKILFVGILFGELVCEETDFQWVWSVMDEQQELSLKHPDENVICSPISMMAKRLQDRVRVDMSVLCQDTIRTLEDGLREMERYRAEQGLN